MKSIDEKKEKTNSNDIKYYFCISRIIYALASVAFAYIIIEYTIIRQKAWLMFFIPVLFIFTAILFIKNSVIKYKNTPDENAKSIDKTRDALGFLMVIVLFLKACGVNLF